MDPVALATFGTTWQNGMVIADLGYTSTHIGLIHDVIELESPIQTELEFTVTLYRAQIDIITDLPIEIIIKTSIKNEVDLESKLQIETNIRTRLIKEP